MDGGVSPERGTLAINQPPQNRSAGGEGWSSPEPEKDLPIVTGVSGHLGLDAGKWPCSETYIDGDGEHWTRKFGEHLSR